jgi:DNA-binding CsgD family transcriptional regulator
MFSRSMAATGAQTGVRETDVRAMLGFVGDLASLETPPEFRAGVLPGLRDLVPCEIATYNQIDFEAESMLTAEDPAGVVFDGAVETFVRLGHQNPLVERYQRTRDGRPYKWSDLITRRQLHRTELYEATYARMSVEYQMAFCLPAPPELIIAFALSRSHRDFSERDRRILNLIRAPMIQAYRTVERYADLVERLAAVERGLERNGVGVAMLERSGDRRQVAYASGEAARAFGLEGPGPVRPERLPRALRDWLRELNPRPDGVGLAPPLVLAGPDGTQSAVRFLPAREPENADVLLVEPAGELVSIPTLRAAGLTAREAEVLRLVALGHTNPQIAAKLTLSPRTVQKHLEHVYAKLGASSRTQALLTAWSIGRTATASEPAMPESGSE